MSLLHLNLKALREYQENALGSILDTVANLRRKNLEREEVLSIYKNGILISLTGDGLINAPALNYAFFYYKGSKGLPLKISIRCFTSRGSSHSEVIQSGGFDRLIVAGTLSNGGFSSLSTTWLTEVPQESGRYYLGLFLNDLILSCYNIERNVN